MTSLIAQFRPPDTSTLVALQGPRKVSYLAVCNTSAAVAHFTMYHSVGTNSPTWGQANSVHWQMPVPVKETAYIEFPQPMDLLNQKARVAIQSDVANALTISFFGE